MTNFVADGYTIGMTHTADNLQPCTQDERPAREQTPAAAFGAPSEQKALLIKYAIFIAVTLGAMYIVQLFRLFAPLFQRVYYGNLTTMFFYILCVLFWIPCLAVLYLQIKKHTGYKVFRRARKELSLKRSLIIYACAVVPIFIVSAALGFELKVVFELGKRVTGIQLGTNGVMYAYGAVKLLLGVILIELVQECMDILYRGKYAGKIPWGGIFYAVIVGLIDVIVAYATGAQVLFAWLYVAFHLLYGVIYLLSEKNFYVTYFVSLIIYIL